MRLSYSAVNSLMFCGWSAHLERQQGFIGRPHLSTIAGSVFHEVTEARDRAFALGAEPPTIDLETEFDKVYEREVTDKGFTPDQVRIGGQVRRSIEAGDGGPNKQDREWFLHHMPSWGRQYDTFIRQGRFDIPILGDPEREEPAIEMEIQTMLGTNPIKGFIDRVLWDRTTQEYVIMDIKAGVRTPNSPTQMGLYAMALREMGLPVTRGIFYMARRANPVEHDLSLYTRDYLEDLFSRAEYTYQEQSFMPNFDSCSGCGLVDICKFKTIDAEKNQANWPMRKER